MELGGFSLAKVTSVSHHVCDGVVVIVLCCVVLCCVVLCYVALRCNVLHGDFHKVEVVIEVGGMADNR
jgi:hypothetical protein